VPDNSENTAGGQRSCEFDFSALALPVPLEFADTDSLQDVPIDVFEDEDVTPAPTGEVSMSKGSNTLTSLEMDEEPGEVEVKPILRSALAGVVSVVVEPPSSEDSSQARHGSTTSPPPEEQTGEMSASRLAGLGERIVEGAEEPIVEQRTQTNTLMATSVRGTVIFFLLFKIFALALCPATKPSLLALSMPSNLFAWCYDNSLT